VDSHLSSAVRQAVASGEFTRARHLWEEYVSQCRERIRHGADRQGTLEEARQLMVWCRQMTLAARAQAQVQLDNLGRRARVAAAYERPSTPPPGSIRFARY
jgi:hypothetical protein